MKRKRALRSHGKEMLSNSLQIPFDSIMDSFTQIQLLGNREAVVEGCKGILEYDEHVIRLNINKLEVRFFGTDMSIRNLNSESVIITGNINNIEFGT